LQALTTNPTSTADRQVIVLKAQNLTDKFNSVTTRLDTLTTNLNTTIGEDIKNANQLIKEISDLSRSITSSELGDLGTANDLKDRRQEKLEFLAKLVNFQSSTNSVDNTFNLSVGGVALITSNNIADKLQAYTPAGGQTQVATVNAPTTALTLTGGGILGIMDARDGAIATLQTDVNDLAAELITQVNAIHKPGFALDNSTGRDFFTGTDASDIGVNTVLLQNPNLIQASAVSGEPGNNQAVLALARLASEPQSSFGNLTFVESYNQSVANFGQVLSNVNSQILDQDAVNLMLTRQRDSLGGVSVDEEMTNLVIFQRAFQASAKMISTIDELLQSVIALSR
jgi:flagellar hook-associated protein 1